GRCWTAAGPPPVPPWWWNRWCRYPLLTPQSREVGDVLAPDAEVPLQAFLPEAQRPLEPLDRLGPAGDGAGLQPVCVGGLEDAIHQPACGLRERAPLLCPALLRADHPGLPHTRRHRLEPAGRCRHVVVQQDGEGE